MERCLDGRRIAYSPQGRDEGIERFAEDARGVECQAEDGGVCCFDASQSQESSLQGQGEELVTREEQIPCECLPSSLVKMV